MATKNNVRNYKSKSKMIKYMPLTILLLLFSCKKENNNDKGIVYNREKFDKANFEKHFNTSFSKNRNYIYNKSYNLLLDTHKKIDTVLVKEAKYIENDSIYTIKNDVEYYYESKKRINDYFILKKQFYIKNLQLSSKGFYIGETPIFVSEVFDKNGKRTYYNDNEKNYKYPLGKFRKMILDKYKLDINDDSKNVYLLRFFNKQGKHLYHLSYDGNKYINFDAATGKFVDSGTSLIIQN